MRRPRLVGGISEDQILRLNLWGGGHDENVQLRIEDLHSTLYRDIPAQFVDLVEIAAYVFCADQAFKRTGQDIDSFGDKWRRDLRFHIPVRCAEVWNRPEIKDSLTQVLDFLSDDHFSFRFYQADKPPAFQQYLRFADEAPTGRPFEKVIMFSGGLDSTAGAIEETLINKSRVVLVTHESTPKSNRLLREMEALIAGKAGSLKPLHLRVRTNKQKRLGKDYTQRTRSFLFAAFGITVAKMLGIDTLRFYENGVVSLNLPVSAQVVGSRATRTTHPRVLRGFQELFSLLDAAPSTVENPFLLATKADVIQKITRAGCGDMIRVTSSCAHTWERSLQFTHCGVCSQCIDRRLAMTAAQAAHLDPAGHYRSNIFLDPRPADEDKMMLAAYLDRATSVDELANTAEFIAAFPQIVDALDCVPGGATKAAAQFFDLYKRHAKEVSAALSVIVREYSDKLVEGVGGSGCLLRTLTDSRGASPQQEPEKAVADKPYHVLFQGDNWLITYDGVSTPVKNWVGTRFSVYMLRHLGQEFRHAEIRFAVLPPADPQRVDEILKTGTARGLPATDEKTTRQVEARLREITEEKEAAQAAGDFSALDNLEGEEEKLSAYLSSTTSNKGHPRWTRSIHATTRVSVGKALKEVREKIGKMPGGKPLADHLKAIRAGTPGHLIYNPSPAPEWTFEGLPEEFEL